MLLLDIAKASTYRKKIYPTYIYAYIYICIYIFRYYIFNICIMFICLRNDVRDLPTETTSTVYFVEAPGI